MGRKKLERRIKKIVLQVGDDIACFDMNQEEKINMSSNQKQQIISKMRRKIHIKLFEQRKQQSRCCKNNESAEIYINDQESISTDDEDDIAQPIEQEEPDPVISIVLSNQNNIQSGNSLYLDYLNDLFQLNNQSQ